MMTIEMFFPWFACVE